MIKVLFSRFKGIIHYNKMILRATVNPLSMVWEQLNAAARACWYVISKWGSTNPNWGDDLSIYLDFIEQYGQAELYGDLRTEERRYSTALLQ